jgi:2-dehydropantoate 2-reductase
MRILVLGAGGTGGYFGGRLAQAGADVTFLVRPARGAQLDVGGLVIRSPLGDAALPVSHICAPQLPSLVASAPFDLVLLSCKAYDLDSSIEAIAPAVGQATTLLPILNGLRHYQDLDDRFGAKQVLGGLCFISADKADNGDIRHLGRPASLTFGERSGNSKSLRCRELSDAFTQAGVDHTLTEHIQQDQWTKFAFLAALAAGTCLMRAGVGDIVATEGGRDFMEQLYRECLAIAEAEGWPVPADAQARALDMLTRPGSRLTASMLRDLEAGRPIEGEHIVGDLFERARRGGLAVPLLSLSWRHLQAYEARRQPVSPVTRASA